MKRNVFWLVGVALVVCTIVWAGDENTQSELELIKQQALNGDTGDQLLYGLALLKGRYGFKPDAHAGMIWIQRAAEGGDAYAAMLLGNAYSKGEGIEKDSVKAVNWWQKAADRGNTEAKYHLAKAYMNGTGIAKDPQKAGSWLTQAADEGYSDAQYLLGRIHHEGIVVEQNQDTAMQWLRRAAANGHMEAVHLLGVIESLVKAATPLTQETYEELHKRALEHDPHAQYELALRYETGAIDVNADPEKAMSWLIKAADNNNILAMHHLAHVYENGKPGVSKDDKKARYWRERAKKVQSGSTSDNNL